MPKNALAIEGRSFDSGYEQRFDFPDRRQGPCLRYMIATTPRTGSSYLSHLLWGTGCLGAPLEYVDFWAEQSSPALSPSAQVRRWKRALRTRTSPNGVFGFKCFLMHLYRLRDTNEPLLDLLEPNAIIYLERRDKVAQAISYARAHLTGVWCKEQVTGANERVRYSREALERAERWIDAQAQAWEELFQRLEVEPLRLWYEDVAAAPAAAVAAVADHLGVEIDPDARIVVPPVMKQSGAEALAWVAAYEYGRNTGCTLGVDAQEGVM